VLRRGAYTEPAAGTADSVHNTFVLVAHQHADLGDETVASLYVAVQRAYELLPGPWVSGPDRYDPILGPVNARKRVVVDSQQSPSLTATTETTYAEHENSAYIVWQTEETWSDGTGTAGNPVYPTTVVDFYDDAKGAVQQSTQAVVATGSEVGSLAFTQTGGDGVGTVAQIRYEPFSPFILKKITETWALPGPVRAGTVYTGEQQTGVLSKQLQHKDVATQETGPMVVSASVQPVNELYSENESVTVGSVFGNTMNSVQRPDVLPEKFRAAIPESTTAITTAGTVGTPTLATGEIQKTVEQVTAQKMRTSTKSRSTSGSTLTGKKNYVMRTAGTVTETYAASIQTPDSGLTAAECTVDPLGDGGSIKTTVTVASHPALKQYRYDKRIGGLVETTEQFVSPPTSAPGNFYGEIRIIDEDHSLQITETVPTSALASYVRTIPTWSNIPIPPVLTGIDIVWNEDFGEGRYGGVWQGHAEGDSYTLTGSNSGDATSTVSFIPEVTPKIKEYWTRGIPTKTHYFYTSTVSVEAILARLSSITGATVEEWPIFKPEPVIIALIGGKMSVQAKASAQGYYSIDSDSFGVSLSESDGESYDFNHSNRSLVIPPTIHAAFNLSGDKLKTKTITATAAVRWYGYGGFPSTTSDGASVSKQLRAFVSPTSVTATSPSAIPVTGFYLVDCHIEEADWGYSMVMAEVLDASKLA
jgi:hypothetical protein